MADRARARQGAPNRRSVMKRLGLTTAVIGATPTIATARGPEISADVAMRRPGKATATAQLPTRPSAGVIALNRMGFGPRPGDIGLFAGLGTNNQERMAAYVAQQLDPGSIDDSAMEARITAANFASVGLSPDPETYLAILWDWYVNGNAPGGESSSSIPRDELIQATFIRSVYSSRQLIQVLADFWHNHFNVFVDTSSWVRAALPHMDMIIRNNLLGNFRVLLEAVAKSTAMLRYLDNYTSSNAGPNENFSRELFELHTLGAENYLGVIAAERGACWTAKVGPSVMWMRMSSSPLGALPAGPSPTVRSGDGDTGLFYYRAGWHDRFQKNVLGTFIPADQIRHEGWSGCPGRSGVSPWHRAPHRAQALPAVHLRRPAAECRGCGRNGFYEPVAGRRSDQAGRRDHSCCLPMRFLPPGARRSSDPTRLR